MPHDLVRCSKVRLISGVQPSCETIEVGLLSRRPSLSGSAHVAPSSTRLVKREEGVTRRAEPNADANHCYRVCSGECPVCEMR